MGRSSNFDGCKGWSNLCGKCKYGKLVYSQIIKARVFCCEYKKDDCKVTKGKQGRKKVGEYDERRMQKIVNDH